MNTPHSPAPSPAAALQPFVDQGSLAGAVMMVTSKTIVYSLDAVGYADIEAKQPMHEDSFFWIASITKPVTATAMMMLVDEGKVNIDDPVQKYLPEFAEVKVAHKQENGDVLLKKAEKPLLVKHLLSHTSGMVFMSPLEMPIMDRMILQDVAHLHALLPLQSEPGTAFQYCNSGFSTAGRIIEVMSGMPYEDFLLERLFEPLGMDDTVFVPDGEQLDRLVKVYKSNEEKTALVDAGGIDCFTYPLTESTRRATPGGGLFSSISDLSIFGRMILRGGEFGGKRYISEEAIKVMSTRHTPSNVTESYGLGWWINARAFDHGGAYATHLWIDPEKDLVTVLFMQHKSFPKIENGQVIERAFLEAAAKFAGK